MPYDDKPSREAEHARDAEAVKAWMAKNALTKISSDGVWEKDGKVIKTKRVQGEDLGLSLPWPGGKKP